jgi:hypothetical protein
MRSPANFQLTVRWTLTRKIGINQLAAPHGYTVIHDIRYSLESLLHALSNQLLISALIPGIRLETPRVRVIVADFGIRCSGVCGQTLPEHRF